MERRVGVERRTEQKNVFIEELGRKHYFMES